MKSDVQSRPQPIEEPPEPGHVRSLAIVTAVVIGSLWLVPLSSSLWVDELGTWWVVKDGLGDAVHRAITYQAVAALLLDRLGRPDGGRGLGGGPAPALADRGSLVRGLLYRLARHLISREAARLAVLVFAAGQVVAFEASEARPYAMATLAVDRDPPTRSCGGSMTGAAGPSRSSTPYSPSRWCGCTTSSRSSSCPRAVRIRTTTTRGRPRSPFAGSPRSRSSWWPASFRWPSSSPRCGIDARP